MRTQKTVSIICGSPKVQSRQGQLVWEGTVQLSVPVPVQDEQLPATVEAAVEQAGQQFKRRVYQQLMEKLDAELLLAERRGKEGQGIVCRGFRAMTWKTVFGTVVVSRHRVLHKADASLEVLAARVWRTPQQVTITQGLRDAVCDAMLQESSRKSLRQVEERAGEAGLLGRVTVLNVVHEEGRQLRAAAQRRAEAVLAADPEAARCLVPDLTGPIPEEQPPPAPEEPPWDALVGFPGAPAVAGVDESHPRRVEAQTVMVQADEVSVPAQPSTGNKEIRVYNGVVSTAEQTWCFCAENAPQLTYLVGALLAALGVHRGTWRLLFINDGARWIRDWFQGFQGVDKSMVLCWYHLARRCLGDLGQACGKKRAKELGGQVLEHLWEGRVDEALKVLADHRQEMHTRLALDQLVSYLENRRPYLPCYRQRQEAGVWIASNRVEKLNDWTVSERCKGRAMDWTRDGVLALAVLETVRRNGELLIWRSSRTLPAWTTQSLSQLAV